MTAAARIVGIAAALGNARSAVEDGAAIDLAGLVDAVETAMHETSAAPLEERAALTLAMLDLLKQLDSLVIVIARQHHGEAQSRAAAAYAGLRKPRAEEGSE